MAPHFLWWLIYNLLFALLGTIYHSASFPAIPSPLPSQSSWLFMKMPCIFLCLCPHSWCSFPLAMESPIHKSIPRLTHVPSSTWSFPWSLPTLTGLPVQELHRAYPFSSQIYLPYRITAFPYGPVLAPGLVSKLCDFEQEITIFLLTLNKYPECHIPPPEAASGSKIALGMSFYQKRKLILISYSQCPACKRKTSEAVLTTRGAANTSTISYK